LKDYGLVKQPIEVKEDNEKLQVELSTILKKETIGGEKSKPNKKTLKKQINHQDKQIQQAHTGIMSESKEKTIIRSGASTNLSNNNHTTDKKIVCSHRYRLRREAFCRHIRK
jgi:hypothetical protein